MKLFNAVILTLTTFFTTEGGFAQDRTIPGFSCESKEQVTLGPDNLPAFSVHIRDMTDELATITVSAGGGLPIPFTAIANPPFTNDGKELQILYVPEGSLMIFLNKTDLLANLDMDPRQYQEFVEISLSSGYEEIFDPDEPISEMTCVTPINY